MQEDNYDDELFTFLLQQEPENFQGCTIVKCKFVELLRKEDEKQALLRTLRFWHHQDRCKAKILSMLSDEPTTIVDSRHHQLLTTFQKWQATIIAPKLHDKVADNF